MHLANRCVLCNEDEESLEHILSTCKYTKEIWASLHDVFLHLPFERGWNNWVNWASNKFKGKDTSAKVGRLTFCGLIYKIWRERNARIHEGISHSPTYVHLEVVRMRSMLMASIEI